jgi:hypothetical protein
MRIGLLADLHGRLDPLLGRVLSGVDRILVAGDVVDADLLDRLAEIAPVEAVRGNNDRTPALRRLPAWKRVAAAGYRILVLHDRNDPRLTLALAERPDILVVGHSHRPLIEAQDGLLVVNPGSAGPKRFRLPRTAGVLSLSRSGPCRVDLWDLERDAPYGEGCYSGPVPPRAKLKE